MFWNVLSCMGFLKVWCCFTLSVSLPSPGCLWGCVPSNGKEARAREEGRIWAPSSQEEEWRPPAFWQEPGMLSVVSSERKQRGSRGRSADSKQIALKEIGRNCFLGERGWSIFKVQNRPLSGVSRVQSVASSLVKPGMSLLSSIISSSKSGGSLI